MEYWTMPRGPPRRGRADFVDIQGDAKPKPRFRTRAKMLWDDNYLYIAAEIQEPHVWATLTNHDSVIFQDPDFEVFMDPKGETQPYYEFEMNALNTTWDLRLNKPYMDQGKPQQRVGNSRRENRRPRQRHAQ